MNTNLFLRYVIELAMIIPAAAIAVMPAYHACRVRKKVMFVMLTAVSLAVIIGGAALCTAFNISSNTVLFPSMIVMFGMYCHFFNLSLTKKAFCFANAVFLCGFSTTYNTFLTAPLELSHHQGVYTVRSGLICLGIALLVTGIFTKTLLVKFPELLETESIDPMWRVLMLAPILSAAAMIWMNPISAENVMTGRLRMICIVILLAIPLVALFLYHIFWWLSKKLTETAQLQQSYDLLKMEEKQFAVTQQYLQEASELRHDFRHHLHVILDYAEKGQTEEQIAYIRPLAEVVDKPVKFICKNQPLNAICSHYSYKAKEQGITILWGIDLGEKSPISETELCAVIGNLLDNAIKAVSGLSEFERVVDLRVGMFSKTALVISIKNPFDGAVPMNKDGLPVTEKKNHGIGLRSVSNIVKRHDGNMVIQTANRCFDVSIVMYAPD